MAIPSATTWCRSPAPVQFDLHERRRSSAVTASCGICGTATLDQLYQRCDRVPEGVAIEASQLLALPDRLRKDQRIFARTGGLHGAGLYASDGRMLAVREDVGRHNAVDKLVGWAALQRRLPLAGAILVVSGRVSFEIVQKAAIAGVPILVAVSAPSSLAVHTAALARHDAGRLRARRAGQHLRRRPAGAGRRAVRWHRLTAGDRWRPRPAGWFGRRWLGGVEQGKRWRKGGSWISAGRCSRGRSSDS